MQSESFYNTGASEIQEYKNSLIKEKYYSQQEANETERTSLAQINLFSTVLITGILLLIADLGNELILFEKIITALILGILLAMIPISINFNKNLYTFYQNSTVDRDYAIINLHKSEVLLNENRIKEAIKHTKTVSDKLENTDQVYNSKLLEVKLYMISASVLMIYILAISILCRI